MAVQQFHRIIQYNIKYSSIMNGLLDVQLWVSFDNPTILYYDVGGSNINVPGPRTRVKRALYSYLISFRISLYN